MHFFKAILVHLNFENFGYWATHMSQDRSQVAGHGQPKSGSAKLLLLAYAW